MKITRKVARPMMAAIFIHGGIDALRNPESKKAKAETVAPAVADTIGLEQDTVDLIRINGGVMVGARVMLALGWLPRLAATALAGTLVPTTFAVPRLRA